jgi:Rrf2 family protein
VAGESIGSSVEVIGPIPAVRAFIGTAFGFFLVAAFGDAPPDRSSAAARPSPIESSRRPRRGGSACARRTLLTFPVEFMDNAAPSVHRDRSRPGRASVLRVSARVDYALRALVALAGEGDAPVKGDRLAREQSIPFRFLEVTLGELRHGGIVASRRGADGGYWLARPAADITVADILITLEGSLIDVRSVPFDDSLGGPVHSVTSRLWSSAEAGLDRLLGAITLADLAAQAAARPDVVAG